MNLLCPKCDALIEERFIHIYDRNIYCKSCGKHYRISVKIRNKPIRKEEIIEINEKYTRIEMIQNYVGNTIKIKPKGFTIVMWPLSFFAVLWNVFTWAFYMLNDVWLIFLMPFILIGLYSVYYILYTIFGKVEVNINTEFIEVKWKVLFFRIWSKREFKNLDQVVRTSFREDNGLPIYYVTFLYNDGSRIRFGSGLSRKEQKWLIRELNRIVEDLREIIIKQKNKLQVSA